MTSLGVVDHRARRGPETMTVTATVTCAFPAPKDKTLLLKMFHGLAAGFLRNNSGPEMSPCELAAIVPEVTINNLREN